MVSLLLILATTVNTALPTFLSIEFVATIVAGIVSAGFVIYDRLNSRKRRAEGTSSGVSTQSQFIDQLLRRTEQLNTRVGKLETRVSELENELDEVTSRYNRVLNLLRRWLLWYENLPLVNKQGLPLPPDSKFIDDL